MGIPCFLIEPTGLLGAYVRPDTGEQLPLPWMFGPGAMWAGSYPAHWESRVVQLPEQYWREHTWYVVLPNRAGTFCLDQSEITFDNQTRKVVYGAHWTWTGVPPNVTVTPSINAEPGWHGHLTNGQLEG